MKNHPRRAVLIGAGLAGMGLTARTPRAASAQFERSPSLDRLKMWEGWAQRAPIRVSALRGRIHLIRKEPCANMLVLSGQDGDAPRLMTDSGYASCQSALENALRSLGRGKIDRLINLQWHWDHTDGNAWLHRQGAVVTATPQTRARLTSYQLVAIFGALIPPIAHEGLPTDLVRAPRVIQRDGERMRLEPYGPAHDDSGMLAHFEEANVLQTGDAFLTVGYPIIDYSTGGSVSGLVRAARRLYEIADADTLVVPGHGDVARRHDLQQWHSMIEAVYETIRRQRAKGLTVDDVLLSRPTARFDPLYGANGAELFVRNVYEALEFT